jgi:hypothetical protein
MWKLKPTQMGRVGRTDQTNMFDISAEEEHRNALKLRVNYTIPSASYAASGQFLARDKSVKSEGPLFQAASSGKPVDGEGELDLGQARGTYRIHAIPLWTPSEERGPNGENAVAAVLKPLSVSQPKKKKLNNGPSLF